MGYHKNKNNKRDSAPLHFYRKKNNPKKNTKKIKLDRKVECANHVCKCYRSALEKLVKTNSSYKGSGGLTAKMRKRW